MSRRKRGGPSSPEAILLRAAQDRAAGRLRARDPGSWGVSGEALILPANAEVEARTDHRGQILARRKSDPFDLLHAGGGLSDDQHRASRRLFRDYALAAGVREGGATGASPDVLEKIDGGRPSDGIGQVMIDAGRRANVALGGVGPVNRQLLDALIAPIVAGQVIAWRGTVQRVTGETHVNAQGAMVRQACEALRLVYAGIDAMPPAAVCAQAGLRPFNAFEAA